jgi:drug/metabolite transporter (DMT)-like permease
VSERARAEAALLAVTLVWGVSFTLVKNALGDVSTMAFLAIRFTVASGAIALFSRRALATGMLADPLAWRGGWRAGLCLAVAYVCQTSGLRWTTPSRSAFLTSLCTALVPVLAAVLYRRLPRGMEILGVLLAVSGTGLLTLTPGQAGGGFGMPGRGELLTLGCAVAFAGHILVTGHYAGRAGLNAFSLIQLVVATLFFWLWLPWFEPFYVRATPRLAVAVAVTGLICTAVAFTVQAWAQRHTSPTRAALIFSMEPVSAAATSYLVAGETLTPLALTGAGLIVAGVLAVELRPLSRGAAR